MRMQEALEGLAGIGNIADDILVYGLGDSPEEAEADHDRNLQALLSRAQARNLKLNPTKIQFKLTQLKFMGHHVSEEGVAPDPAKVEDHSTIPAADQQVSSHGKLFECLLSESIICDPPSFPADSQRY